MDDCKQRERRQVPLSDVAGGIKGGVQVGDALRLDGISGMSSIKRAKLVGVRRERGRLEARYGKGDPRLATLDRQMSAEHRLLVQSRAEKDRVDAPKVERNKKGWTLHGHVRDADGHPLAKHRVGLFAERTAEPPELAGATTDEKGYFRIAPESRAKAVVSGGQAGFDRAGGQPVDAAGTPDKGGPALGSSAADAAIGTSATTQPRELTIAVRDAQGRLVHRECRGVVPRAGGVVYRSIIVDSVSREDPDNLPTRFLGNNNSREMHDLRNRQPACNIASIQPRNRVFLASENQGVEAGYDYCAHCFGAERSQR